MKFLTRLLLPAVALLGLSSCVDPLYGYGYGPGSGYSTYGSSYRGYSNPGYSRNYYSQSRSYPNSYYGYGNRSYSNNYRSYPRSSSVYQPIGLGLSPFSLFGGGPSYYSNSNSRSRGGYYPNDPDDRNNPRHPNYIGPAGSRSSRFAPRYYANDPDDRNNPSHPNYIGPAGSRFGSRSGFGGFGGGHSYYANDPDDRNNPSHPNYIGPPRRR